MYNTQVILYCSAEITILRSRMTTLLSSIIRLPNAEDIPRKSSVALQRTLCLPNQPGGE